MTVSVISNDDSWWNEPEHSTVNVHKMEKLPHLVIRAHYRLPDQTNHTYIGVFGTISLTETQC
jgi:hypothetical protein